MHGRRAATQSVSRDAPLWFALFLVWHGIRAYNDGVFWPPLRSSLGSARLTDETEWGRAFSRAISRYDLATVEDDSGLAYVAPILLHAGLPDSCLPEYFREICWKSLVSAGFTEPDEIRIVLSRWRANAGRIASLRLHIKALRACEDYLKLIDDLNRLTMQGALLSRIIDLQHQLEQVRAAQEKLFKEFREVEREIQEDSDVQRDLIATLPRVLEYQAELAQVLEETGDIYDRLKGCQQHLDQLAKRLFDESWSEPLGKAVSEMDISALEHNLSRFGQVSKEETRVKRWYRHVQLFSFTVLATALALSIGEVRWVAPVLVGLGLSIWVLLRGRLLKAIQRVSHEKDRLRTLVPALPWAIDPLGNPSTVLDYVRALQRCLSERQELLGGLQSPRDRLCDVELRTRGVAAAGALAMEECSPEGATGGTYGAMPEEVSSLLILQEFIEQRLERWAADISKAKVRHQVAEQARERSKVLSGKMAELAETIQAKERELAEVANRLLELGLRVTLPDTPGVHQTHRSVLRLAEETAERLEHTKAVLLTLLGSEITSDKVRAYKECTQEKLRAAQDGEATEAGAIPALAYVDRPIERFLTYGRSSAESFLLATVQLLVCTLRSGEPTVPTDWPQSYRYQRVYRAFEEWWTQEGRVLCADRVCRAPNLRLVAWTEGGEWAVGVRIPESLRGQRLEVTQDQSALVQASREGCWYLNNLNGEVVASAAESLIRLNVSNYRYRDMPVLLFRGWDGDTKFLPALRRPGRNNKLLLVFPETWRLRDSEWALEPLRRPSGYQACCLDVTETGVFSLISADGDELPLNLGAGTRFELTGSILAFDRDHEDGPLFNGEPPRLRCLSDEWLLEVGWAEVSPGGSTVYPSPEWLSTGAELGLTEASGCFEVVLYDRQGLEVERLPFRYAANLRSVSVHPYPVPIFPDSDGHSDLTVCFHADPPCTVQLRWPAATPGGTLRVKANEATVLPASPDWDCTVWELSCGSGRPVPLELVIQRVWWTAGECSRAPCHWTDRLISVSADWVRAASDKALWLRCEPRGFRSHVKAGFGHSLRSYRLPSRGVIEIPLREFCDYIAEGPEEEHVFRVFVQGRDGAEASGQVARYSAASLTELCFFCIRDATDLLPSELTKCCGTCSYCRILPQQEVFCSRGEWTERLSKAEFERRRARDLCGHWDGEYPGQPFSYWEEPELRGAEVRTRGQLEELFGTSVQGTGVICGFERGRVCIQWHLHNIPDTWLCRHHYHKYCDSSDKA